MKKKHIVLLHHVSDQGGGTKSLMDIAVMLKNKYDVTVCIPKGSKQTLSLANKYEIRTYEVITPIPTLNVFSGGPSVFNRVFLKGIWRYRHIDKLVEEILALKPDVIILNSLVTSIIARRIPRNIKVICFIRETIISSPFDRLFRDTLENYINGVAYIAEHEKEALHVHKTFQVVIPDVLEPSTIKMYETKEAREMLGFEPNKFYLLYMGGGARLKGIDTILRAATYLDEQYCTLIVGNLNPRYFSIKNILTHLHNPGFASFLIRTRRLLRKLEGDCRIKLLGYQPEISKLMCASDVIVFPSYKPHQPRPCIEAGIYYKPVIISDFEATEEYFKNGYNALTFKPMSAKDLAEKIKYFNNNENEKKRIGANNHDMSIKEHNYYKVQEETIEFIEAIASVEK